MWVSMNWKWSWSWSWSWRRRCCYGKGNGAWNVAQQSVVALPLISKPQLPLLRDVNARACHTPSPRHAPHVCKFPRNPHLSMTGNSRVRVTGLLTPSQGTCSRFLGLLLTNRRSMRSRSSFSRLKSAMADRVSVSLEPRVHVDLGRHSYSTATLLLLYFYSTSTT